MQYLIFHKHIKDMIVYNNIMLKQFPKHEKYLLANKIRELGYNLLELAIAFDKKYNKKTDVTALDVKHETLRQLVNLAYLQKYIDDKKYLQSSKHIDVVGKMIGSLKKEIGL
jgi:hypothetical protein